MPAPTALCVAVVVLVNFGMGWQALVPRFCLSGQKRTLGSRIRMKAGQLLQGGGGGGVRMGCCVADAEGLALVGPHLGP